MSDRFPGRKLQPDNETNYSYPEHLPVGGPWGGSGSSLPPVVLDHVGQLDDEFALLVLLTALEGMLLMERKPGTEEERWLGQVSLVEVTTLKSRLADPKIMGSCW